MYAEGIFIAEATIKKQKNVKGIFYYITPTLGRSADYCEKQRHNRMVDSDLAWKHITLKYV